MLIKKFFRKPEPAEAVNIDPSLRDLYTRMLIHRKTQHTTIGVTSAKDGEGKTRIATNLAITLANDLCSNRIRMVRDILLLECNQSSTTMSQELAIPAEPGLIHYLRNQCTLEDAVKRTGFFRLWGMPRGSAASDFPVLIRTARMQEIMQCLRGRFGVIILDLPSALPSTDLQVLSELTDGLLLVVRSGLVPAKMVSQALEEIGREKVTGIILNDYQPDLPPWLEERL